jgi:tRNA modification GTPase
VVQGIPVQVLDTAGIRQTEDMVEQIGVERSLKASQNADLVLLTIDAAAGWTEADQAIFEQIGDRPLILVINKTDIGNPQIIDLPEEISQIVHTAAAQQQGIEDLEMAIAQSVHQGTVGAADLDFAINQRQAAALTSAKQAIEQVIETIAQELPLDFWTIDLRSAIQSLGEITGEGVTESVLDRIFSRFCIGK